MIKKIIEKFGGEVKKMRKVYTPGTPMLVIMQPQTEEECLTSELQHRFRSGVGMLLYLVKHLQPDIANAVTELSKGMMRGKGYIRTYCGASSL